jgi:hypothetical protein
VEIAGVRRVGTNRPCHELTVDKTCVLGELDVP